MMCHCAYVSEGEGVRRRVYMCTIEGEKDALSREMHALMMEYAHLHCMSEGDSVHWEGVHTY